MTARLTLVTALVCVGLAGQLSGSGDDTRPPSLPTNDEALEAIRPHILYRERILAVVPDGWVVVGNEQDARVPGILLYLDYVKPDEPRWIGAGYPALVYVGATNSVADPIASELGSTNLVGTARGRRIYVYATASATNAWPLIRSDIAKALGEMKTSNKIVDHYVSPAADGE